MSAPATGRSPRAGRACVESPEPGGRRRRNGPLRPGARRGIRDRTASASPTPVVSPSCYTGNLNRSVGLHAGRGFNVAKEGSYVGFGGVEGGHPADYVVILVPDVEGPVLLESGYVPGLEPGEDGVGLDGADDLDAVDCGGTCREEPGHGVGVGGVGPPQVIV